MSNTYEVTRADGSKVTRTRLRGRGGSSIIQEKDSSGNITHTGDPISHKVHKAEQDAISKANFQDTEGNLYNVPPSGELDEGGSNTTHDNNSSLSSNSEPKAENRGGAPYSDAYLNAVRTPVMIKKSNMNPTKSSFNALILTVWAAVSITSGPYCSPSSVNFSSISCAAFMLPSPICKAARWPRGRS